VVVNGGHDQGCTALGMGVTAPGRVLLACGTSWVVTGVAETPAVDTIPAGMDLNYHPAPERWTVSQSLGGLGASLEWWLQESWQGLKSQPPVTRAEMYAALDEALAGTSPGSDGLFFLPLAGGHTEPAGIQRGGFVGLRLGHRRSDMARAILEGAAYELRWALDNIRQAGIRVEWLWMVGGAARSPVWPGIVADVTGVSLSLTEYDHWPALGAALLAGVGAGVFESLEVGQARFQQSIRHLIPDETCRQLYTERFEIYQALNNIAILNLLPGE
jgi:xylulokinase